jgi:hypothetical protein
MSHMTKTYQEVLSLGTFDEDKGTFTFDNIVLKDALLDLYTKAFSRGLEEFRENLDRIQKEREPMKLSEAGHTSNIEYWKAVAKRYQSQRDMALQKVQFCKNACCRRPAKRTTVTIGYDRSLPPEHVATIPSTIFYAE